MRVRKAAISRGSGACTKPPFSGGRDSLDFGTPHVALTVPAIANARSMLADYEVSPLDPAIDEALTGFIAKKKASMPDAFS